MIYKLSSMAAEWNWRSVYDFIYLYLLTDEIQWVQSTMCGDFDILAVEHVHTYHQRDHTKWFFLICVPVHLS